jgi:hypothetical protein
VNRFRRDFIYFRLSVVMRKITGGNRSQKGADAHEILMNTIKTHKLKGENFLEKSAQFMRTQLKQRVLQKPKEIHLYKCLRSGYGVL